MKSFSQFILEGPQDIDPQQADLDDFIRNEKGSNNSPKYRPGTRTSSSTGKPYYFEYGPDGKKAVKPKTSSLIDYIANDISYGGNNPNITPEQARQTAILRVRKAESGKSPTDKAYVDRMTERMVNRENEYAQRRPGQKVRNRYSKKTTVTPGARSRISKQTVDVTPSRPPGSTAVDSIIAAGEFTDTNIDPNKLSPAERMALGRGSARPPGTLSNDQLKRIIRKFGPEAGAEAQASMDAAQDTSVKGETSDKGKEELINRKGKRLLRKIRRQVRRSKDMANAYDRNVEKAAGEILDDIKKDQKRIDNADALEAQRQKEVDKLKERNRQARRRTRTRSSTSNLPPNAAAMASAQPVDGPTGVETGNVSLKPKEPKARGVTNQQRLANADALQAQTSTRTSGSSPEVTRPAANAAAAAAADRDSSTGPKSGKSQTSKTRGVSDEQRRSNADALEKQRQKEADKLRQRNQQARTGSKTDKLPPNAAAQARAARQVRRITDPPVTRPGEGSLSRIEKLIKSVYNSPIVQGGRFVPGLNKAVTAADMGIQGGDLLGQLSRKTRQDAASKYATRPTKPKTTVSYSPDYTFSPAVKQLTQTELERLKPNQKWKTQTEYDKMNDPETSKQVSPQTGSAVVDTAISAINAMGDGVSGAASKISDVGSDIGSKIPGGIGTAATVLGGLGVLGTLGTLALKNGPGNKDKRKDKNKRDNKRRRRRRRLGLPGLDGSSSSIPSVTANVPGIKPYISQI